MQITVQRRAEVALRSLDARDRNKVMGVLSRLEQSGFQQLHDSGLVHKMRQAPGVNLYVMRATTQLRIVLSFQNDKVVIEDIVPHDRLDRLPAGWR
jgi:hypothetical protein